MFRGGNRGVEAEEDEPRPATRSANSSTALLIIPVVLLVTLTAWPDILCTRRKFWRVVSEKTTGSLVGLERAT